MEDIYSLYVQASDLEPRARMAWLESIQLPPESRRELDELLRELAQYTPGRTKVRTLVLGAVEGSMPNPEQRIGECVGPYRLERLVVDSQGRSAGNMGHVYFARRVDGAFEQTVAVKVIQQIRDDPESRSRFIRERRYLGRLRHRNVVRILDAGALPATADTGDEQPYFIMEWVEEGLDIATYCRTQELSLRQRIELFCQVCEGVAYAHSQGVVHRDLKPQNVLVDGQGVPRLLDFGISSRPEDDGDSALMRSAMTLAYASPEQLAKASVGPASDIYSLGVILFEILAGHRPYEVTGEWEADRILVEQMVTPRLGVEFDLNQIVQKALNKDLGHRYQHMDQLVADLRRFLRREPVKATMDMLWQVRLGYVWSALYWLLRYSRKYIKPLLTLALLALLVLLAAAEFGRRQYVAVHKSLDARKLAGEAALALERKEYNAAGMLALESEMLESEKQEHNDVALRILQKVIPHLPHRLYTADLPQPLRLASFSPDHSLLALLLENGVVQIRNAGTGVVRYQLPANLAASLRAGAACLVWSQESSQVALFDSSALLSIWDAGSGRPAGRKDFRLQNGSGGFDCSGSAPGAALRYAGPSDWDVLLTNADSALWLPSQGERLTVADTVSCAPAVRTCMVSTSAALELLDLRTGGKVALLRGENPKGVLSPDGQWAAVQLPGGVTQVYRLGKDSRVPVASFGTQANPSHPVRFQAGGRLLLEEGEQWRIFVPWLNESLQIRRAPVDSANSPKSAGVFNPQAAKANVLMARNEVGTDPVAIPTEGLVSARAGDEVSGSFAVADQAGRRLSMWRLPEWPGASRFGAAVMASDSQGHWAAGWTRNNALVTYSLVDGSVERVLQREVAPDGPDSGPRVWALGGSRWFLSLGGGRLASWDPRSGKELGKIELGTAKVKLAADGSGRWLALVLPEAHNSELYEMPGMRHMKGFLGYEVVGIATVAGGEIAVLLGGVGSPKTAGTRRVAHYRLQFLAPNASAERQVHEIDGGIDLGVIEFDTIERAVGPPCGSTATLAKEPREILFPMARVQAGITTGCAVLRVDQDRDSIRLDDAPSLAPATPGLSVRTASVLPGSLHLDIRRTRDEEMIASESFPDGLQWSWHPTLGGMAFHTGETWREVLFSFAELKARFCAGGVANLPPDFVEHYKLPRPSGCE